MKNLIIGVIKCKDGLNLALCYEKLSWQHQGRTMQSGTQIQYHIWYGDNTNFGVPEYPMHLHLLLENFNIFHSWYKVWSKYYWNPFFLVEMSPSSSHSLAKPQWEQYDLWFLELLINWWTRNFLYTAFPSHQSGLFLVSLFIAFWRYGGLTVLNSPVCFTAISSIKHHARHCTGQKMRKVCGKGLSEKCNGIMLLRV